MFIWLRHGVRKNRLDQIIWINKFAWLRYGVEKNRSDQIMWVKGFLWPRYDVKKNWLDQIIWITIIWLGYGVKKNRTNQIIWVSHECGVWCVSDDLMYEMNYENLICCFFVDLEISFMKTQFLKLFSLPFFLCVVCFVFKTTMNRCVNPKWIVG